MATFDINGRYEGMTEEAFPELFDIRAMPTPLTVLKTGQLPADQIRKYFEDVSLHIDFTHMKFARSIANTIEF